MLICEECKKKKLMQKDIHMEVGYLAKHIGKCEECGTLNCELFTYEELPY